LVRPPDEASIGKPVSPKASYSAHHVALTAAAFFSGALACALIAGQQGWFSGEEVWLCVSVLQGISR
jgi:hypothetical protein